MQIESPDYKVQLAKLKTTVTGRYSRVAELSGYSKQTVYDVLNGKKRKDDTVKKVLTAALQVREEIIKKQEAFAKLIS